MNPAKYAPPVVAPNAPKPTVSFGDTWQEAATRVEAFIIKATDTILSIKNLPHDETRDSLELYIAQQSLHVFALLPGEYIMQVEVCYTEDAITALKIFTTQRRTPWFGKTKGAQNRELFRAEAGDCINALHGKYGPSGCSELGVVYTSTSIAAEGHSLALPPTMSYLTLLNDEDEDSNKWVYRTFDREGDAIVITTCESGIQHVRIVTKAECERVTRSSESFEGGDGEHWFPLAARERITAVAVRIEDLRVKAISFKTTCRVSHSFGAGKDWDRKWLTTDESYICGFELCVLYIDSEPMIKRLYALYVPHKEDTQQASSAA